MVIVLEQINGHEFRRLTSIDTITLESSNYTRSIKEALAEERTYSYLWMVERVVEESLRGLKVVYPTNFTEKMLVEAVIKHKQTFPELYI